MKAFSIANVIMVLVSTILATLISVGTFTIYLNRYLNKPDINIQFCDSKQNLILVKQPSKGHASGRFRLALQIANNSEMTYKNVRCEFMNRSIVETEKLGSTMLFDINDWYSLDSPDKNGSFDEDTSRRFIPLDMTTIHPGSLPLREVFLASIRSNYAPKIVAQNYNPKGNENPLPIIEYKLAIRISGEDYPQRIYYLTIYFGREETLSYFNQPIFEIDTSNNYKLKLVYDPNKKNNQ